MKSSKPPGPATSAPPGNPPERRLPGVRTGFGHVSADVQDLGYRVQPLPTTVHSRTPDPTFTVVSSAEQEASVNRFRTRTPAKVASLAGSCPGRGGDVSRVQCRAGVPDRHAAARGERHCSDGGLDRSAQRASAGSPDRRLRAAGQRCRIAVRGRDGPLRRRGPLSTSVSANARLFEVEARRQSDQRDPVFSRPKVVDAERSVGCYRSRLRSTTAQRVLRNTAAFHLHPHETECVRGKSVRLRAKPARKRHTDAKRSTTPSTSAFTTWTVTEAFGIAFCTACCD